MSANNTTEKSRQRRLGQRQKRNNYIVYWPQWCRKKYVDLDDQPLVEKDEGTILIEGRPLESYHSKELAKKVSILKQANNINIRLTIRELVSFGRFPYSQNRLTKRIGLMSKRRSIIWRFATFKTNT